jgi:hypothetical protein
MVAYALSMWNYIALALFFLWAAKFLINIPSVFISAGVLARKGQSSFWYYSYILFGNVAYSCIFEMRSMLKEQRFSYFKPYTKFSVIRNTLIGYYQTV